MSAPSVTYQGQTWVRAFQIADIPVGARFFLTLRANPAEPRRPDEVYQRIPDETRGGPALDDLTRGVDYLLCIAPPSEFVLWYPLPKGTNDTLVPYVELQPGVVVMAEDKEDNK